MSEKKYMIDVLVWVLTNLNSDSGDAIPESENELEKKLEERVDDFYISFTKGALKECCECEKRSCSKYAYCKIYGFYNSINGWYCDAYIWEKEANSYFTNITVGCYCLVRDFMSFLEDYRDGRI